MQKIDLTQEIVTAALRLPAARCSTRAIAEHLGVSQSTVSRFWRSYLKSSAAGRQLKRLLQAQRFTLAAMWRGPQGSSLLLRRLPSGHTRSLGAPSASFMGRLRAVLGADAVFLDPCAPAQQEAARLQRFKAAVVAAGPDALLVTDAAEREAIHPSPARVSRGYPRILRTVAGAEWAGLIEPLSRLPENLAKDAISDLVARLQHWYQNLDGSFVWTDPTHTAEDPTVQAISVSTRTSAGKSETLEDQVLYGIQTGLTRGDYRVGQELSEQTLAKRLGMGRARVRRGLVGLQEQGLVGVTRGPSLSIQLPSRNDIAELYEARTALGTLAVRAAARRRDLEPTGLMQALDELRVAVRNGDSPQVQRADATFQNVLARVSGLARIPAVLESFHQQMMFYIAIFGVRYDYPMHEVLEGDRALAAAVRSGDQAEAVSTWQQKMVSGAGYMLDLIQDRGGRRA